MASPARRKLTAEEFFDWLSGQETRYELVDGEPLAMAGAERRHDHIVVNGLGTLWSQLRGRKCRPFSADTAVRIPSGNIRYPDFGIDCGPFVDKSMAASEPALVAEVSSPSSRLFDCTEKLGDYKSVPSIAHIILIDPDWPQARYWWRDGDGFWQSRRESGLDAVIDLPVLELRVALADLYAGLDFRPRPMLVDVYPPGTIEGHWNI